MERLNLPCPKIFLKDASIAENIAGHKYRDIVLKTLCM